MLADILQSVQAKNKTGQKYEPAQSSLRSAFAQKDRVMIITLLSCRISAVCFTLSDLVLFLESPSIYVILIVIQWNRKIARIDICKGGLGGSPF